MEFSHDREQILVVLRMVIAPVSIMASLVIIVMIGRSAQKLSTTQHRLLLASSISDILFSSAISLGSIPSPKGTLWLSMGTLTTCKLQAFFYMFGLICIPCFNAGMCIFYLLKVKYDMSDEQMRTRVEPFLLGFPVTISTIIAMIGLMSKFVEMNPAGTCSLLFVDQHNANHTACPEDHQVDCRDDDEDPRTTIQKCSFVMFIVVTLAIAPFIIFSSMALLFRTVLKQEQRMAQYGRGSLAIANTEDENRSIYASHHVRVVMFKGIAYASAWLISFIFLIAILIVVDVTQSTPPLWLLIFFSIFISLQGLSSFIIFIYPKVFKAREQHPNVSSIEAFLIAVTSYGRTSNAQSLSRWRHEQRV
jgi:hypothetical protein